MHSKPRWVGQHTYIKENWIENSTVTYFAFHTNQSSDDISPFSLDYGVSICFNSVVVKTFLGLETKTETETLDFRSWDRDRDFGLQVLRPRRRLGTSGLETKTETLDFRSRDRDRELGLQVSRPRPRPGPSGLETETKTWAFRSRDRDWDRDLDKMNSSALESRDHGLEITTLCFNITMWQGKPRVKLILTAHTHRVWLDNNNASINATHNW